jgi:hypothetical protein
MHPLIATGTSFLKEVDKFRPSSWYRTTSLLPASRRTANPSQNQA